MGRINSTALTSGLASKVLNNSIYQEHALGYAYSGSKRDLFDRTFLSAARALLFERIDTDKVNITITDYELSTSEMVSPARDADMQYLTTCLSLYSGDDITFIQINISDDANCEYIGKEFLKKYPDFILLKKVTDFYKKDFKIYCFIRPSDKKVYISCDLKNVEDFHKLQCCIPVILPWYFNKNKLSEEETEFIKIIQSKDLNAYNEWLSNFVRNNEFIANTISTMLVNVGNYAFTSRKNSLQSNITAYQRDVNYYYEEISSRLKDIERFKDELFGLEKRINEGLAEDYDWIEFLNSNKSVEVYNVTDSTIFYYVKTFIDYFDADFAETMIKNYNSLLYRYAGCDYDTNLNSDMKLLYKEVFIKQSMKINVIADWYIDFKVNKLAARSHPNDIIISYMNYIGTHMPNPHLNYHACLGNYKDILFGLTKDGKYLECFNVCIASTQSLNFGDSVVIREFARDLFADYSNNSKKYIVNENGDAMSVQEAIEYIKSKAEVSEDE